MSKIQFGLALCIVVCIISDNKVQSWFLRRSSRVGPSLTMGAKISNKARSHIGSTIWAYENAKPPLSANTNKCNLFVANVVSEAGGSVPQRHWFISSPIGAREWENPWSSYLRNSRCWNVCSRHSTKKGDVLAYGGHVGIVTGTRKTTSAARYRVVEGPWGFRADEFPTCWRYSC